MFKKLTLITLLSCLGITTALAALGANTLGENSAISNALIKSQVDNGTAGVLLNTPYKGFYKINSKVQNKKIKFVKVKSDQSFPDQRWQGLAKGIAGLAEVAAYTTGSRIDPRATAYVAFYDVDSMQLDPSQVMKLPTSVKGDANTLAVLVVKHKNHSKATSGAIGNKVRKGSDIYFFELTL